jgi:AcrR family transcriptional regulator
MPLHDLLDERRPHRADAARNFDAILAAARAEFTEHGTDAALDDIARRAGVGPATLYRNFATRGDLVEAVYVAEVDALCQDATRLAAEEGPQPATNACGVPRRNGCFSRHFSQADGGIRTHDPRFTRAVLWPTELRRRTTGSV